MATTMDSTTPEVTKRIQYNRDTRDYDCFVRIDAGAEQYIGSTPTYGEAESACADYAFDYYIDNCTPEKAATIVLPPDEPLSDDEETILLWILGQAESHLCA